jgi:L-seryl-tRNA(Ser) seleniumtransferase
MAGPSHDALRLLPSVDAILQQTAGEAWAESIPKGLLVEAIRAAIDDSRTRLAQPQSAAPLPTREHLAGQILDATRTRATLFAGPAYRRAINATGIILHTGLGRAVLPRPALDRLARELAGYSVLQVDTGTGKRSRRDERIEWLIARLTGAEAATVVNNNAAATILVLNTIARNREVIVSRGQLVEIGGSFRLPDVMAMSGARLVEVGTTNKTHARDYEQAITENTAAILRVHPSNYRVEGFTAEVPLPTLVEIAHANNLPLIDDVGAGAVIDPGRFGLPDEPTLPGSIQAGADLVLCSADKMIGGPQGGLILGRADLVRATRSNPLFRALRVDKITLSILETTLSLFLDEQRAMAEIPTLALMQRTVTELNEQAERIARAIREAATGCRLEVIDGFSQLGSGSLPGHDLPSRLIAVHPPGGDADGLAARLRSASPPVFARIAKNQVLIDPRTVLAQDEGDLIRATGDVLNTIVKDARAGRGC